MPEAIGAPQTGDDCPAGCPGHLVVTTSKRRQRFQVRYVACWRCNAKPENNKILVPVADVPRRHARKKPA